MLLDFDAAVLECFLNGNDDCSRLSEREYIADIYDIERPLTLDLIKGERGFELVAAAYLEYDPELDGWYMGERATDPGEINAALRQVLDACDR